MVMNKYIVVTLVAFMTLSKVLSYPAPADNNVKKEEKQDSLFGLPFLEFKNGGVRVNFGGYHAEAGLGGLLGGSSTGGGLYAGAGTPYGAHASADLGGLLNGQRVNGGGLNARAGLGNGGPEAAAGLDGNLDSSDKSNSGGRLYTATSNGGKTKITIKGLSPNQSNIQHISPNMNDLRDLSQPSVINGDTSNDNKKLDQLVRREIDSNNANTNVVEPSLAVPITDPSTYSYSTRPCRRPRLCNNWRKVVIQQQLPFAKPIVFTDDKVAPVFDSDVAKQVSVESENSSAIHGAQTGYKDIVLAPGPSPRVVHEAPRGTLFDDIFNIPISALKAVNQLLNNKAG